MKPNVDLAIDAYNNRKSAELSLAMAQRDVEAANWALADAKEYLLEMLTSEAALNELRSPDEHTQVLLTVLGTPK